ncbi:MAG TPA: amidohydrolase family protein [Micromonosporaceae bacterium]|nr:amidohydrolase family protein [Micromonosporaceae bacterium]
MYDGPVIDIHAHIALTPQDAMTPEHQIGVPGLVAAVRLDGVARAAAIVMAGRGEPACTSDRNDAVLAAAEGSDGFLVPVVSVHPHDADAALTELDRVAGLGARIVKLHPNTQSFDVADDAVAAVTRRAGERGMPVLFDAYNPLDADQPGKFIRLAVTSPEATLILAHLNGPRFADLLAFEIAARYPWWPGNVYHDLSGTAEMFAGSPYAEQLRWVVRKLGTDRVLYGSDWPLCDPAAALAAVRQLGFTEAEERQIMYANAAGLLDHR